MKEKTVLVKNTLGAREAAFLVQTAGKFTSRVTISLDNKTINAKSIMGTISLGISAGQNVTVKAEGQDESAAVEEVAAVLA